MATIRHYNASRVRRPLVLAIIAGLVGALIGAAALVSLNRTRAFLAGAERLEARVVAVQVANSTRPLRYLPVFAFTTPAGQALQLPGWQSGPDYDFAKGETVAIWYNPAMADSVRIDNWQDSWKPGLDILFVAAFFLLMALAGLVLHRRWLAERPDYVARNDWLPEDAGEGEEIIYVNTNGRVRFLANPKPAAIVLGLIGGAMMAAGIYGVASGADMGSEDQVAAYFAGAAVFLGLAAWAGLMHRKYQRVRARRAHAQEQARGQGREG